MIGIFFMAVVFIPIVLLIAAFTLDKPRNLKVSGLLLFAIVTLVAFVAGGLALFGAALHLIIPS